MPLEFRGKGWNWSHPNPCLLQNERQLLLAVPVEESLVPSQSSKPYLFWFPHLLFPSVTGFTFPLPISSYSPHLGLFGFTPRAASSNPFLIFLPMLVDSLELSRRLIWVFWASGDLVSMIRNTGVLSSSSLLTDTVWL